MNNQERNREALIEHIAEQDRIIRRRNEQIANQAHNARESQRAIEELDARNNSLAADLADAVARADKAEKERDEVRDAWEGAVESVKEANSLINSLRAAEPRALTADDITYEARGRAYRAVAALSVSDWDDISGVAKGRAMALVEAVITEITRPEPPTRPEGAEAVSSVLGALREDDGEWMTYASDEDLDGLADALAERGVRVVTEEQP